MKMKSPGRRNRGQPKRWFTDMVVDNEIEVELRLEHTWNQKSWRVTIRCDYPGRKQTES